MPDDNTMWTKGESPDFAYGDAGSSRAAAPSPAASGMEIPAENDSIRLRTLDGSIVRLEDYDGVIPGGAKRVRAMLESEAAHRRWIEAQRRRSERFGFSMTTCMIAGCLMLGAAALIRACG